MGAYCKDLQNRVDSLSAQMKALDTQVEGLIDVPEPTHTKLKGKLQAQKAELLPQWTAAQTRLKQCLECREMATGTAKTWTVEGQAAPELQVFDALIKPFMTNNNVPASVLAVTKDGRLVLARGYSYAGADCPPTPPTSLTRIASCSKPITTIAIFQLLETATGGLTLDTKMQDVIEVQPPPGISSLNPYWNKITVKHLLSMSSGLVDEYTGYMDGKVCNAFGHPLPASKKEEWASYLMTLPPQFQPGTSVAYSNAGFFLLSVIIEKITGDSYAHFVSKRIFNPLGLSRPKIAGSLMKDIATTEIWYHPDDPAEYPSVMSSDPPVVPNGYGNINLEVGVASGGWLMAAVDYAKILAAFDVGAANPLLTEKTVKQLMWVTEEDPPNNAFVRGWGVGAFDGIVTHGWGGVLPGLRALVSRRSDGVSIVFAFNRDEQLLTPTPQGDAWNPGLLNGLQKTASSIASWPKKSFDLFNAVGIPPF
jgi:CubicO group peptidase (beta-lactamase class C family)